jgi:ATP-dependent Lon protease
MEIIKCQATQSKKSRDCKATFVSRQLKEHGLTAKDLTIGKKQLEKIVEGYTRESGVRGLEAKKCSSNSCSSLLRWRRNY